MSFIDGYTVSLTESEGTTHTGNYFPIEPNYTCNYAGSASIRTTMAAPGYDPIDNTTNSPTIGMLKVLPLCYIPLNSGMLLLYPIVDISGMGGQVVDDTSRFFMKDSQAVYIKALKMSDGSYLEVTNPIFIKSRLVVGDSWETAPKLDITKFLASEMSGYTIQSNLTLNARAKFYVVGKDTISLPIGKRNTIRLEQANDISMSGTIIIDAKTCTMNMSAQIAVIYHMIADTGIVYQNITGPISMTIVAEGQTMTISMVFNTCDLRLTSLSRGIGKFDLDIYNQTTSVEPKPSFNKPIEEKMWKVSQAIVKVITKKLSL